MPSHTDVPFALCAKEEQTAMLEAYPECLSEILATEMPKERPHSGKLKLRKVTCSKKDPTAGKCKST